MQDRADVGGSNASQLQVPATVRWESSSGVTVRGSLKLMARSWNTFRQGCWCGAGSQIGTSIRRIRRQSGGTQEPISRKDYQSGWQGVLRLLIQFLEE